jgi:hypothetical protein
MLIKTVTVAICRARAGLVPLQDSNLTLWNGGRPARAERVQHLSGLGGLHHACWRPPKKMSRSDGTGHASAFVSARIARQPRSH